MPETGAQYIDKVLSPAETVILPHPLYLLLGVSIGINRGCRQNDRTLAGWVGCTAGNPMKTAPELRGLDGLGPAAAAAVDLSKAEVWAVSETHSNAPCRHYQSLSAAGWRVPCHLGAFCNVPRAERGSVREKQDSG